MSAIHTFASTVHTFCTLRPSPRWANNTVINETSCPEIPDDLRLRRTDRTLMRTKAIRDGAERHSKAIAHVLASAHCG